MDMYNVLKAKIKSGSMGMTDIQYRVKRLYATGDITESQMEELLELSQQYANPEQERPEVMEMLRNLEARVAALEGKNATAPDEGGEAAEYEAWEPWDGISDKYKYDAVVSHKDKLWQSKFMGQNVWEPGAAGTESLWVEYQPAE